MSEGVATGTERGVRAGERWFVGDLRKLAAGATAGLVSGFVVAGIGGRLAMMLLAVLNPEATGVVSDDGFMIGKFDLVDTLNLVLFTSILGVLGGVFFVAVRSLRFGPPWFRTASIVVGPAVVVGALLVHQGGVDFTLLDPAWLAIALFVVIPGLYAWATMILADRWLEDDSWFLTSERGWIAGLVPVLLLGPALVLVAAGLLARLLVERFEQLRVVARRIVPPIARVALVAVFTIGLVDLVRDTVALV